MFCAPAGAGRKFWIFWMHPRPGEVCLADLGLAGKTRPVVIVSRSDPDAPRALVQGEQIRGSGAEVQLLECRIGGQRAGHRIHSVRSTGAQDWNASRKYSGRDQGGVIVRTRFGSLKNYACPPG